MKQPADKVPFANGGTGRDSRGRFRAGNRAAAGHKAPLSAVVAARRAAAVEAITPEQMAGIMAAQVQKALTGDSAAAHFCFRWVMGEAVPCDLLAQVERLEALAERGQL